MCSAGIYQYATSHFQLHEWSRIFILEVSPLFEERNNDGLSKDPDNVKKRKPRTSHKRKELGEGGEVVI